MSNSDDRKALEGLLRSLSELAAASDDVRRVCDTWLQANEHDDDPDVN